VEDEVTRRECAKQYAEYGCVPEHIAHQVHRRAEECESVRCPRNLVSRDESLRPVKLREVRVSEKALGDRLALRSGEPAHLVEAKGCRARTGSRRFGGLREIVQCLRLGRSNEGAFTDDSRGCRVGDTVAGERLGHHFAVHAHTLQRGRPAAAIVAVADVGTVDPFLDRVERATDQTNGCRRSLKRDLLEEPLAAPIA
jgi:hypothetical protein